MRFFVVICAVTLVVLIRTSNGLSQVQCYSDPALCKDPICTLKPLRRNIKQATYGCTPVKPITQIWVRVTQYKKTNANRYMPGAFDITQDFCAVLLRNSTAYTFVKKFVDMMEPGSFENYEKVLHPCPYVDKWSVQLLNDERKAPITAILGRGDFKTTSRFYNEFNQTFYEMTTFYYYK